MSGSGRDRQAPAAAGRIARSGSGPALRPDWNAVTTTQRADAPKPFSAETQCFLVAKFASILALGRPMARRTDL